KTSGTTQILNRIQFANAFVGYAVGNNGVLLKTIDSGENWTFVATGSTNNFYGLSVLNENTFFISGDNGLVKKSIDGGISFSTLTAPSNLGVFDIQFFGQLIGYAEVGTSNTFYQSNNLYKTIDGGISWTLLCDAIDSFYFVNEYLGFINKSQDGLYKTINGGTDLLNLNIQTYEEIDLFAINENLLWNIKNQYALCWCTYTNVTKIDFSSTQGFPQIESYFGSAGQLMAIHFANENIGFVVGVSGKIYKNTNGINTTDIVYVNTTDFDKPISLKIYPNPTSDNINIAFNETQDQPFAIEITDVLGKKIFAENYQTTNAVSIDAKNFSKGIYFLTTTIQDQKQIQKIIKN
ncbi:MAG: T9SS type A sorting domain-containing protein, partial [Flavobacterium sp.]|nr:T9SS type A sorting domain-containing protein [Flavobacterium sp.]